MNKKLIAVGAWSMMVAVALGAYANHGFRAIAPSRIVASFQTGVSQQIYHSLALILLGALWAYGVKRWMRVSAVLFCAGIVLFSLDVYFVNMCKVKEWYTVLSAIHFLPPFGGFAFMFGWLFFGVAMIAKK